VRRSGWREFLRETAKENLMKLRYLIAGTAAALLATASVAAAQEVIVEPPAVVTYPAPAPAYVVPEPTYVYPGAVYPETFDRGPIVTPDYNQPVVRPSESWRSRPGDSAS
jgi:hypothetical protein